MTQETSPAPELVLFETDAGCSKKELDRYINSCQPVLIRGLNLDAKALKRWTPEYFHQMIKNEGDVISPRRHTPVGTENISYKDITMAPQPISEIVADCIDPEDKAREIYVPGMRMTRLHYLEQDAPQSPLLQAINPDYGELFMGRNTQCVGHFHPELQALLCQMQGQKHVRLYPPSEFGKLQGFSIFSKHFSRCKINFYQHNRQDFPNTRGMDVQRYPEAAKARYRDLVLNPGDALFIPVHWTHVTQGKDWNVSMAYFWKARWREWGCNYPAIRTLARYPIKLVAFPFTLVGKIKGYRRMKRLSRQIS
ncbi:cupin-like domain-containing protein [Thalassomonas viridans]|uniref:Cupin-like domain-containing protein n=1 Tax=Thalassomonas viridans TaxID=137584 RepID=A0AAE9ZBY6_9GAMM|nr:cupin-like domain-containing protein [Thalassomonas viridans]WDE09245.1 cupin-like domain-containing protein [Thalassomonas viridans]